MRWGPSGLVQNREWQAIVAGKRDVLCESANLEVSHVTGSRIITQGPITIFYSRIFIVAATIIIVCARKKIITEQKKFVLATKHSGLVYWADFRPKTWNSGEVGVL